MVNKLENVSEYITNKFKGFKGFISVKDFRTFLLFNLSEDTSAEDMVKKMMEGGNPNKNLYYDEKRESFILEMLPAEKDLVIYLKQTLEIQKQTIKFDNKEFFNKYLSSFEQTKLLDKKGELRIVKYINNASEINKKYNINSNFEIVKIYEDFLSFFFAIGGGKSFFVIDGADDEPDILFIFMISISNLMGDKYIPIHVCLDYNKICKDTQFLKINNETHNFEGVKEIKEISHAQLYNNQFVLVVHTDSFDVLS
ncbi:MAG: hypothetical protein ACTSWY_05580 [Promethearchaeota archaeon]